MNLMEVNQRRVRYRGGLGRLAVEIFLSARCRFLLSSPLAGVSVPQKIRNPWVGVSDRRNAITFSFDGCRFGSCRLWRVSPVYQYRGCAKNPAKRFLVQVDRNLMLYLPRLTVFVTIEADRPGAWFPGPLGPYQAWFPTI